jgi:IS4 transposase
VHVVGYEVDRVKNTIATNRYDLAAEQIAVAYKLRWDIVNFSAWWKRHLKVNHFSKSHNYNGLMRKPNRN